MAKEDHGPTCADSPLDHHCGYSRRDDAESDQGVTWREWSDTLMERARQIASLHVKLVGAGGMTDGTCAECAHPWPCQTAHIAKGWGYGDGTTGEIPSDCFAEGWCHHEAVKVEQIYEPVSADNSGTEAT
jgi:hypothetical protein